MSCDDGSTIVQLRQLDTDIVDHLYVQYGVDMAKVLTPLLHQDCQNGDRIGPHEPTIRAEVLYAVREEMALHLSDVVLRRTDLGTVGHPGLAILTAAASIMAKELNWTKTDVASEISAVEDIYKNRQGRYIS
jgi:glycerol-3-phosphate dehydrogenase